MRWTLAALLLLLMPLLAGCDGGTDQHDDDSATVEEVRQAVEELKREVERRPAFPPSESTVPQSNDNQRTLPGWKNEIAT